MKKRMMTVICLAIALAFSFVMFSACGEPKVDALVLIAPPTVTSGYNEEFAIADDGKIAVKDKEGNKSEIKVTLEMIDLTGFDNKTTETQTLKIKYGGLETTFECTLVREAAALSVKKAPTVTSGYTEMPLTIAGDGLLGVTYKDGETAEVSITEEMLDLTDFDIDSPAEQDVKIKFGGLTTTFKVTLKVDVLDNTGELATFRFEAEDADIGGGTTGVEECKDNDTGRVFVRREDGSVEKCVKNLFLGEGGFVTFRIVCDKKTNAAVRLSIGSMGFDTYPLYDKYARLKVNGAALETGIVFDPDLEKYGGSWWTFQDYEMEAQITLRRGVNEISLVTYDYADIALEADDVTNKTGGRNFNWLELDTTSSLALQKEE